MKGRLGPEGPVEKILSPWERRAGLLPPRHCIEDLLERHDTSDDGLNDEDDPSEDPVRVEHSEIADIDLDLTGPEEPEVDSPGPPVPPLPSLLVPGSAARQRLGFFATWYWVGMRAG